MKYCPLMSFRKQYCTKAECLGEECALAADEEGNCLIKQALGFYVEQEKQKRDIAENGWRQAKLFYKNGLTKDIAFNEPYYEDGRIRTMIEESE